MKFNSIKIKQDEVFHAFVIKVEDLCGLNVQTDYHHPKNNEEGYQRIPTPSKIKGIKTHLKNNETIIPIPLLLNIRDENSLKYCESKKILDIKNEVPLYVIDGNHRYQAYKQLFEEDPKTFGKHEVAVSLLNMPRVRETSNFLIINKTASPVRTDLAERNLATIAKKGNLDAKSFNDLPVDKWKIYAVEVVDLLVENPDCVLYKAINRPGEPKTGTLNQSSVTDSLKFLYKDQSNVLFGLSSDKISASLNNMWGALYDTMPECFQEPKEYQLLKTMGVNVIHRTYRALVPYLCKNEDFTKETFSKVFSHQDSKRFFEPLYWDSSNLNDGIKRWGIGQASFKIAFEDIWENGISSSLDDIFKLHPHDNIKI